mgnify:CR=1 FL=1
MKNLLLTLILVPFLGLSQVGKSVKSEQWDKIGKLTNPYHFVEFESQGNDDSKLYRLSFQNMEYKQITDISSFTFEGTQKDIDYIKSELIKGLKYKKGESSAFEIGKGMIAISKYGMGGVVLRYKEDGEPSRWTWLSKGQINKVFGE